MAEWQVSGDYMEACSCAYLCPCITSNGEAPSTEPFCRVAMAFHIERGHFGATPLDGLGFAWIAETPRVMADGGWRVGLIIDERADAEQRAALQSIADGDAGGPMALFAPMVGERLGVEYLPIAFRNTEHGPCVHIEQRLEQSLQGTESARGGFIKLVNTFHPANPDLNLAKAETNRVHAFGIDWDDSSGQRNGHFATFQWQN